MGCDIERHNGDAGVAEADKLAKSWCGDNFCYVDPCTCGTTASRSDYFPQALFYSYGTCGTSDAYAALEARDQASSDCQNNDDNTSGTSRLTVFTAFMTMMMMAM